MSQVKGSHEEIEMNKQASFKTDDNIDLKSLSKFVSTSAPLKV